MKQVSHTQIRCNDQYIQEVNITKVPGLWIDNSLNWKSRVEHMLVLYHEIRK